MSSRYIRVDRGSGSRSGQLLRHATDPNRWQAKVYLGRTSSGGKRYKSEIIHGRRRDAEARLVELQNDKNRGRLSPRTNIKTTVAMAAEAWLKAKELDPRTRPRSLTSYRHALKLYILPVLGHERLHTLTLHHATRLYQDMRSGTLPREVREAGWRGEPLGARTVQITHTVLNQLLSHAVMNQVISANPLREVRGLAPSAAAKVKETLDVAQRLAFLEAAEQHGAFYRVLYRVLMDTGMRPGEAMALTWRDLDMSGGTIKVEKAITKDANGQAVVSTPKTKGSSRLLPMFGLEDLLLAHHRWQVETGMDASSLVFTNQDGGMVKPWTFNVRELDRVTAAAGITKRVTLYTFRHTFATLHLASGTPLKIVSGWLGHSSIRQTADTYQHASEDVHVDYAQRHTAWLAAASKKREGASVN